MTQALSTGQLRRMDAFFRLLNMTETLMMSSHTLLLLIRGKTDSNVNAITGMKLMLCPFMSGESVCICVESHV